MKQHRHTHPSIRQFSWLVAGLTALSMALCAPPLAAQQGGDQPAGDEQSEGDERLKTFEQHVASGAKLRKQGAYREALEQFVQARKIADHPRLMLVSGKLREKIGDCPGAREDFEAALDDGRGGEKLHAQIERILEQNTACESRGTIVVACSPGEVALRAREGARELECGTKAELPARTHTLEARADGYRTVQLDVTVEPGGEHEVEVELDEIPEQPVAERSPPPWMNWAAYGGVGLGASLLVGGMISDAQASSRQRELHLATEHDDFELAERLVGEAETAKTRTALLYGTGAVLTAAGALLWVYDDEAAHWLRGEGDSAQRTSALTVEASVGADGASLGASVRW